MKIRGFMTFIFFCLLFCVLPGESGFVGDKGMTFRQSLDEKVQTFLENHKYSWRDMNVPEVDGRLMHEIILEKKYTRALEIGTSTGHSGIWIAWALSKTGGKLLTIEIDEGRHEEALEHFKEAGVLEFIDARLADAHKLVPDLEGPFDFVFIDADKDWYVNYAKAVIPLLEKGGCIAAHNVYSAEIGRGRRRGGTSEYYAFISNMTDFDTEILPESRNGLAVSYKK